METPNEKTSGFSEQDWSSIAESIKEEFTRRQGNRTELEARWSEVDRQVSMTPLDSNGPAWIPNVELPLQAEALELLNADSRRLMFPPDQSWFGARTSLSGEDLRGLDFESFISDPLSPGARRIDDMGPALFANAIATAALEFYHTQYDYRGMWDLANAESFKYGTSVVKARLASRDTFSNEFRGVHRKTDRFPVLTPVPIRQMYLDDAPSRVAGEGLIIQPSHIRMFFQNLNDLKMAAKKGKTDSKKEDGGWMPNRLKDIEPLAEPAEHIQVLEWEGDLIVSRSDENMFIPNVIVSVAIGAGGPMVFRFRSKEFNFRAHMPIYYHRDDIESPYGVGPLIKGAPIQNSATAALNLLMATAHINVQPPVAYDKDDHTFTSTGGPIIEPNALWSSLSKPEPIKIGDLNGMLAAYQLLLSQYADATGITAPRLGQQTKSHQTAFAVDTEQTRGVVRTVDYVRNVQFGPMQSLLHMEYEMARKSLKNQPVFVKEVGAYVNISGTNLPKDVMFEVFGSGGPLEEREKEQRALNSIKELLSVQPLVAQLDPSAKPLDYDEIRESILQTGGFVELDRFFKPDGPGVPPGSAGGPEVSASAPGIPEGPLAGIQSLP